MKDIKHINKTTTTKKISIIIITFLILLFVSMLSIRLGVKNIHIKTILEALFQYDAHNDSHLIIMNLRIPRILTGLMVGAAFSVSGAIMQGMTRNPMASPSLLGINAGAGFGLAVAMAFVPAATYNVVIIYSFLGAACATALIYGVSSVQKQGSTPLKLALAGSAITVLFSAFSQALAIVFHMSQELTFWNAGGVSGARWEQVKLVCPWIVSGLILSIGLSKSITILSLGEEVAINLGEKTERIKKKGMVLVLILTGASVAIVGPVSFVGLIIPHIARFFMGTDYKWVIPYSMLLGGLLIILADILARIVNPPFETPLGAITAVIGVPFFLYLATNSKGGK